MRHPQRAQSTVELALVLPFLVGLVTVASQGGVLLSDQVHLAQIATDGAEWAAINVASQDDTAVRTHVLNDLCGVGGSPGSPAAGATKYCNASLVVTVSARSAPTSVRPAAAATQAVMAASSGCRTWDISVTPAGGSPNPANQSSNLTYNVQLNVHGGTGTLDPIVVLSGSGYPNNTSPGLPTFNPPAVDPQGTSSQLTFSTTAATTPGTYTISVGGVDQCGNTPAAGNVRFTLTVTGTPPPAPSTCTAPSIQSVVPTVSGGNITGVTIFGNGFGLGSGVTFGGSPSALVSVVSATQITAVLPSGGLSPGVYTTSVSSPSGQCVAYSDNSLTICSGPCPSSGGGGGGGGATQNPCALSAPPNRYETVIRITWPEPLFIPWISSAMTLSATQYVFCQ